MLKYPCLVLDHDDTVVQSETTIGVFFQGNRLSGTELIENIAEKGIIDCGFALNYCVIVIQNQAGILEHRFPPAFFF